MDRISQKRQAILACVQSTHDHPSAEWVYQQLKPTHPRLSLATVYRNLRQLKDAGLIRSVGVVNGQERFDGTAAPHPHAVCRQCGAVLDIPGLSVPEELAEAARRQTGFFITETDVRFSGLCARCRSKNG